MSVRFFWPKTKGHNRATPENISNETETNQKLHKARTSEKSTSINHVRLLWPMLLKKAKTSKETLEKKKNNQQNVTNINFASRILLNLCPTDSNSNFRVLCPFFWPRPKGHNRQKKKKQRNNEMAAGQISVMCFKAADARKEATKRRNDGQTYKRYRNQPEAPPLKKKISEPQRKVFTTSGLSGRY